MGLQRAGMVRCRLPDRDIAGLVGGELQAEILGCVLAAARDHRFLSNNPPDVEWSGFLSEGYELKDSAQAEAAFGKAFTAVYGGAVQDLVFTALTDTRFYGLNYNIPSLCFGASGAAMHGFNEYVDLDFVAAIDQGHRAVHRGVVRCGEDVESSW